MLKNLLYNEFTIYNLIMLFMNFLEFKYKFYKLKRQYTKFLKIQGKYFSKNLEKRKFVGFFIKDDEDKILNKEVIDNFDKQIQKSKLKLYKKENKVNKILFSLGIADLNYISILYKYKISEKDSELIKKILKNRIFIK